jgi:hypothetical protein
MKRVLIGLACALVAASAAAAPIGFTRIPRGTYAGFEKNWPGEAPLCAVISSQDEWTQVFQGVRLMDAAPKTGPDPGFWTSHMILLVARLAPGSSAEVLSAPQVDGDGAGLTVNYAYEAPPPATWTMKADLMLAVAKSSPASVVFREDGKPVCEVHPARGAWVSPKPSA